MDVIGGVMLPLGVEERRGCRSTIGSPKQKVGHHFGEGISRDLIPSLSSTPRCEAHLLRDLSAMPFERTFSLLSESLSISISFSADLFFRFSRYRRQVQSQQPLMIRLTVKLAQ